MNNMKLVMKPQGEKLLTLKTKALEGREEVMKSLLWAMKIWSLNH